MSEEKYNFYMAGFNDVGRGLDKIGVLKRANEIGNVYGLGARSEYLSGVAAAMPQYGNPGLANLIEPEKLRSISGEDIEDIKNHTM